MENRNNLTEKVHAELLALQKEMSTLKHYTDDIGRAKENADTMAQAMDELVGRLSKHVERMVLVLEQADRNLTNNLRTGLARLEQIGDNHQERMTTSGKLVEQTSTQARDILGQVKGLEEDLRGADLPGTLKRIITEIAGLHKKLADDLGKDLAHIRAEQDTSFKNQEKKLTELQEELGMTKIFAIIAGFVAALATIGTALH